jgi:hypothetical protein
MIILLVGWSTSPDDLVPLLIVRDSSVGSDLETPGSSSSGGIWSRP